MGEPVLSIRCFSNVLGYTLNLALQYVGIAVLQPLSLERYYHFSIL
jgi:hypothetical protein